jgi:hypothetical protein
MIDLLRLSRNCMILCVAHILRHSSVEYSLMAVNLSGSSEFWSRGIAMHYPSCPVKEGINTLKALYDLPCFFTSSEEPVSKPPPARRTIY